RAPETTRTIHAIAVSLPAPSCRGLGTAHLVQEPVGLCPSWSHTGSSVRVTRGAVTGHGPRCTARRASVLLVGLGGPLERRLDLGLGLGAADPVGALDGLAGLQVLVDLEEVLDLQPVELADVVD